MNDPQAHQRLLIEASLRPVQGDRFVPTGFPEMGAAEYTTLGGQTHLLMESVQSMANRLENTIAGLEPAFPRIRGLPYVTRKHPRHGIITSTGEPHRLASPYLWGKLEPILVESLGDATGGAWDPHNLARALFRLDPCTLIHGAFFTKLRPVARVTRLLTAFIDAKNVSSLATTGVKFDKLEPAGSVTDGRGQILFHRQEYVADRLVAYFNFDLHRLRGYGLSEPAQSLLIDLALLKIRRFLLYGLGLRAMCDLDVVDILFTGSLKGRLPEEAELLARLATTIGQLQETGELGEPLMLED